MQQTRLCRKKVFTLSPSPFTLHPSLTLSSFTFYPSPLPPTFLQIKRVLNLRSIFLTCKSWNAFVERQFPWSWNKNLLLKVVVILNREESVMRMLRRLHCLRLEKAKMKPRHVSKRGRVYGIPVEKTCLFGESFFNRMYFLHLTPSTICPSYSLPCIGTDENFYALKHSFYGPQFLPKIGGKRWPLFIPNEKLIQMYIIHIDVRLVCFLLSSSLVVF